MANFSFIRRFLSHPQSFKTSEIHHKENNPLNQNSSYMSQKPSGPHLPQTPLILSPRKNESVLTPKKKKKAHLFL